jgi:hypothetical protein
MLESGVSPKMVEIWREKFREALDGHLYNIWHLTSSRKAQYDAKL